MTKSQWITIVLLAVFGFSGLIIAGEFKSIMDKPAVIEPVVHLKETKEQFIERINRENLNSAYRSVVIRPIPRVYQSDRNS